MDDFAETIACRNCVHKSVCVHADDYSKIVNKLNDVSVSLAPGSSIFVRDISWIRLSYPVCKHYTQSHMGVR